MSNNYFIRGGGGGGRYRQVAKAFDEMMRRAPLRSNCESSGSEHFASSDDNSSSRPSSPGDLSDLVNSYIEKNSYVPDLGLEDFKLEDEGDRDGDDGVRADGDWSDFDETRGVLKQLLLRNEDGDEDEDRARIREEVESILEDHSFSQQPEHKQPQAIGFKRKLMSRLRLRGFNAGLCKSRWVKSGRHPGGDYEYVDVHVDAGDEKRRYIIEVNLSGAFEIARPTTSYSSLLGIFPAVYVGQPEEMKQVVRLMGLGIRESMKTMGLKVPPWRRNSYMQSKWFGPYKRTTNETPASQMAPGPLQLAPTRFACNGGRCKDDLKGKNGFRVGCLAAVLVGDIIDP